MNPPTFNELLLFYQNLSPSSLAELGRFYDAEAFFKDPFNEVRGLAAIDHIFQHMFRSLEEPKFVVLRSVANHETHPSHAFVTWIFEFNRGHKVYSIRGVTEFDFNAEGRITRHRDYWDAAEELYAKLPLIGGPIRWLARQLSSN
jgi:hypothetical protein